TAEREADVVQVTGSPLRQFSCEPDRRFRAQAEIAGCVGKLAHLPGSGLDDALVPIAGIDAPEPGEPVNELVSGRVRHRRSLRRFQHLDAGSLVATVGGDRMYQMSPIELDERIAKHQNLLLS